MKRDIDSLLVSWKSEPRRRPLLIRGARQVGKSFAIQQLGKTHFRNLVEINFELQPSLIKAFSSLSPQEIITNLELSLGSSIVPGETLLFLDEIQECPEAISSLRYFFEQLPELHVIAAGSLLEFAMTSKKLKMPVGRIQYLFMYPLSFGEFLTVVGETQLREFIQNLTLSTTINDSVHLGSTQKSFSKRTSFH